MNAKSLDIKEALTFGWEILRNNIGFFVKLLLILIVVAIIPAVLIGRVVSTQDAIIAIPLQLFNLVWQSIIAMGFLKIGLKILDRQTPSISDLWSCIPRTLDYIIVKFVVALAVGIGLLLLIIPGIILAIMFYPASYLVIDKNMGAIKALKASIEITRGAKIDVGIFILVILVVNLAGLMLFGVGLLVTLPLSTIASLFVYRKLLAQTQLPATL